MICNFADDNTPYICGQNLESDIESLKSTISSILEWYNYNALLANPAKFQFIQPGIPNIDIDRIKLRLRNLEGTS